MKSKKEQEWIQKLRDKKEQFRFSKILDCYHHYQKTGISCSTDFLMQSERKQIESGLRYLKIPYQVYYANEECERCIIYFGTYQNFVSFYFIENSSIKHSDVLGSLFASNFTNSMIGDIFIDSTGAYFTNLTKYNVLLENALKKIGRVPISLQKVEEIPVIQKKFQDIHLSVSSTRADLILARLAHFNRRKSIEYFHQFDVFVNDQKISSNDSLKEGDILSIRRIGKYIIREIILDSKRKYKIFLQKYC